MGTAQMWRDYLHAINTEFADRFMDQVKANEVKGCLHPVATMSAMATGVLMNLWESSRAYRYQIENAEPLIAHPSVDIAEAMRYVYKISFFGTIEQMMSIQDSIKDGHLPIFDTTNVDELSCGYRMEYLEDDDAILNVQVATSCTPQDVLEILTEAFPKVDWRCWVSLENVTVPLGEQK